MSNKDIVTSEYSLLFGDCLERMKEIPDGSVDLVLTDPPYGTTACKWDSVIPFEPMWVELKRIIKPKGAIVMTASQPFTTALIASNIKDFKYAWVWDKVKPSTGLHAKVMPLRSTEDIVVFGSGKINYFPQMVQKKLRVEEKNDSNGETFGGARVKRFHDNKGLGYPKNLLTLSNADQTGRVHPTQKPVALLEYLIKTYTNENETVLDFTMGSGSTGVACLNTNRKFLGIEMDEGYFDIGVKRMQESAMKGEVK
jgi:site-specific DNA-methyltransferase (adenine-specific)